MLSAWRCGDWGGGIWDVVAEYVYKTDDIILPEDAQAFQFPDTEKYGWMPELVGGEWIKEDEE
jgi:hypothetical protein